MSILESETARSIAALVPFYGDDGGNATRIYTLSGDVMEDRRTIRWIIRKIARTYFIDLEALRKNTGNHLSILQGVPLPFAPGLVLVPLKLRKTIGENDGTGGYINYYAVDKIRAVNNLKESNNKYHKGSKEGKGFRSEIVLKGGEVIPCLFSLKTLKRRLNAGKLAAENLFYSGKVNLSRNYPHSFKCGSDYSLEEGCSYNVPGPLPGIAASPFIPTGQKDPARFPLINGGGCPFASSCHNKNNSSNDNNQSH